VIIASSVGTAAHRNYPPWLWHLIINPEKPNRAPLVRISPPCREKNNNKFKWFNQVNSITTTGPAELLAGAKTFVVLSWL